MSIKTGDRLPAVKVGFFENGKIKQKSIEQVINGHKAILFGVPGAFTPTCSEQHLPGYVDNRYAFKRKGVDLIACVSVNDVFVMKAWARSQGIEDEVLMLADGNGDLARAMGLELDGRKFGLGMRSKRFAMLLEDGVVKVLNVERDGGLEVSAAEAMLEAME